MRILEQNQAGATRCLERSLTSGEITKEIRLDITIELDALSKVKSVSVKNAPAGSSLGTCLKSHYSRISFRTVSGPITFNTSVVASPTL